MKLVVEHPTIEEVFKDFYEVPAFQREYVWKHSHVEALLSDAHDALFDENGSASQSEYFIGSIVSYKENDIFQLIDGQQRITTLFISLCAIRDVRKKLHDTQSTSFLETMLFDQYQTVDGNTKERLRLKPLYEDAGDVLNQLVHPTEFQKHSAKLPASAKNMLAAYEAAIDFMEEKFGDDVDALRRFQASFTKRVRLVRIQTGSISEALRIFETINDRGIGLNALDLLKNLLFMNTTSDEYDKLTAVWKEMVDTIEKTKKGEKPLRFLRYFVLSMYPDARKNAKPLTEDDLYEWLADKKMETGISGDPVGYAKLLLDAAKAYKSYVDEPLEPLNHIYQLSPRARQHIIIMLAAAALTEEEQIEVASQLERLFVSFVLAKEPTKALDLIFANLAPKLRELSKIPSNVDRMKDIKALLLDFVEPELIKLSTRIDSALDQLSLSRKVTTRFVLCRISQHLDNVCGNNSLSLSHYWNNHIEHVLPNQPTEEQIKSFDQPENYNLYKQKLGNLTLLEAPINTSIGRDYFEDKKEPYLKSSIFMTRSISQSQAQGNSTFTKASHLLPVYSAWDSSTIDNRHKDLKNIAIELWCLAP